MVKHFDHLSIVVQDLDRAKEFFQLLGFEIDKDVIISGDIMSAYMGIEGIKAQHVTFVLTGVTPRQEIQLVKYFQPNPILDPNIRNLSKIGFNHICFAVDDIEAEMSKLKAHGFETRNEIMDYHRRKIVFIEGPEGVTVELSQWY